MLLYLDASAIVKIYVREEHSDLVRQAVEEAALLTSHLVAYTEVQRAIAIQLREDYVQCSVEFDQDWQQYAVLPVDDELVRYGAVLARAHGLKALDSLHLAAADLARRATTEPLVFACFDRKLNGAATLVGLKTLYQFPA